MTTIGRPPKAERARELYDQAKANQEERAYKLRLRGRPVVEIAAELGVSDRQVRTYLRRVEDRMKADLVARDGEAGVLKQFAVLNLVLEEALDAWERSKNPSVTRSASREKDAEGNTTKTRVSETVEEQIGNPAYLDAAMKALRAIRDLLGLDAPTVKRIILQEGSEEDSELLALDELSKLPTEKLLALYRAQVGLSRN
jgi:DNA-binding CsgD family transcriptional regulator